MKSSITLPKESSWIIEESFFNPEWLGKYESIMCLGNGYMGQRATTEESYLNEVRDTFVAGTFNKFDEHEVTELPNVPDLVQMKIKVGEDWLDLTQGKVSRYVRRLNLKTGELSRSFIWEIGSNKLAFEFKRFISMDQKHVMGQKVSMTSLNGPIALEVVSGIDGQQTNSGSQHFSEGEKHLFDNRFMQMTSRTTQSNIEFVQTTVHHFSLPNNRLKSRIEMRRRQIYNKYWLNLKQGEEVVIEKLSTVYTSRDLAQEGRTLKEIEATGLSELKLAERQGFDVLLTNSAEAWHRKIWQIAPITITSSHHQDQVALNFAKYHLHVMTPAHDNRMNIGAKGLSGEGYKGHTFWDTEIFMLPYFTYTHPEIAKGLLEFRFHGLQGAHRKAQENGYEGAQFPWEAAWIEDGETTPVWGAADIVTGKATKIWSGFIEQHITSDVAYGVNQYVEAVGDREFLESKGYEIILDTAKFWVSRLEWDDATEQFHINEVIGPDEYKEHVDNNAFTNYTAQWTIQKAISMYEELQAKQPELFNKLSQKLELDRVYPEWVKKVDHIFIPQPNDQLVIPQDDTYLSKKIIPLESYKQDDQVGTLFHEYNLEQVNEMQITKQADVLLLIYLFENLFSDDVKQANWEYYEPKTMHDSSLSLSTHSALAADLGEIELAYDLFKEATNIDMGPAMSSSDEGIHAASLGGIWLMTVFGFGGIRALDGQLRIDPHLPQAWESLTYSIFWHQNELEVKVKANEVIVTNKNQVSPVTFTTRGNQYTVTDSIIIELI